MCRIGMFLLLRVAASGERPCTKAWEKKKGYDLNKIVTF